jgi:hypothetical protein
MNAPRIVALTLHADYACRHSGACCTAGWAIPVEAPRQAVVGTALLVPSDDGACTHYDGDARRCRVHRDHGEAMLPLACQHFPRRALVDERGVSVTLSHYCPTAAELLFRTDVGLDVIEAPPAFPPDREYDGLDGRGEWRPLVRPGLLFDDRSYERWERFLVSALAAGTPTHDTLRRIATAAEHLRGWRPGIGALGDHLTIAMARPADPHALDRFRRFTRISTYDDVVACVPAGLTRPEPLDQVDAVLTRFVNPFWRNWSRVVSRYLATKAFASWNAYQAFGVRTHVAELIVSEQVLRIEAARMCARHREPLDRAALFDAIRAADRLLMHLVDRERFVRWLGEAEAR